MARSGLQWLCAGIWVAHLISSPAIAGEEVDLQLVLAVDVSASIDDSEARLQRQGYADAFRDPRIVAAIHSGPAGRIAVAYFEWSESDYQRVVADWTLISDAASASAFADRLGQSEVSLARRTSISGAIFRAVELLHRSPYGGSRRVIDVSGDGPNNDGERVDRARDLAIAAGITINGLPILNDRPNQFGFPNFPNLDLYYEDCVIGGAGAFIVVARDFATFAEAVRQKLYLEISDDRAREHSRKKADRTTPPAGLRSKLSVKTFPKPQPVSAGPGCDAGERQSIEFFHSRPSGPE